MYCRNCGTQFEETEKCCPSCKAEGGNGEHYCRICGSYTMMEQTVCEKCGSVLSETNGEKSNGQEYLKYTDKVKKINILTLAASIIMIFAVVSLVFLPVFKAPSEDMDYVLNIYDDAPEEEDWADESVLDEYKDLFEKAFGKEKLVAFSYFEDAKIMFKNLKVIIEENEMGIIVKTPLNSSITTVLIFIICFVGFIIVSGKGICTALMNIQNSERGAMLKYGELCKNDSELTGAERLKKGLPDMFKYSVPMVIILDILLTKTLGGRFDITNVTNYFEARILVLGKYSRYMFSLNGISVAVAIPLLLFTAVAVLLFLKSQEEKSIFMDITERKCK